MKPESITGGSNTTFNCHWVSLHDLSTHSADGRFRFSLHYVESTRDDPTIETLIADLSIDPELPDSRATWHRNYIPLAPWIRTHVLKLAINWNSTKQLVDDVEANSDPSSMLMATGVADR